MRKYSVVKYPLLVIALAIVLLPSYHLLVISPAFSRFLMRQMEGNIKFLSNQITDHLAVDARQGLSPDTLPPELADHLREFRQYFNLDKIKLLNKDGVTVYSCAPEEIGKPRPPMTFARQLMEGRTVSRLVKAGRPTLDGDLSKTDLIETYVPLFSDRNQYLGAVEIYYQSRRQDLTFTWLTNRIGAMFGLLALLMAVVIVHLTRRQAAFGKAEAIAAEQLRLARDQWEHTFNAIEDVITIMDEDFRFVRVNRATVQLFGTTHEALIGRHCYEVFRNEQAPCSGCPGLSDLNIGVTRNCEMYHSQLDKNFLVSISRIDDQGKNLAGFVHVARDITEQKKQETLLRQTQKLEAIGVLTGGVAHNFRNILASIKASAQVIEMDYSRDAKLMEVTGWIIGSVDYGSQLVNGLAQFSRLKTRQAFQPLDLNKVVADAFQILRGSMSRKIELSLTSCPEKLAIRGDAGGLMQVIINICNNASDAINGIGIIRLRLRRAGENAILEISDNGPGIAPEVLDRIFEPFFTTKDVDKGTGLGLSTSFGIIREHNGQIRAASETGRGATFTITLPVTASETRPETTPTVHIHAAAVQRILVVDDEPELVKVNMILLEKSGYEVAGAGGCEEALRCLRDWRPDLVMMDLNMPIRDGFSCADAMYEIDPQVRIIMISGSEIEPDANLNGLRGQYIRAFLTKPVNLHDLTAIISRILEAPGNQDS